MRAQPRAAWASEYVAYVFTTARRVTTGWWTDTGAKRLHVTMCMKLFTDSQTMVRLDCAGQSIKMYTGTAQNAGLSGLVAGCYPRISSNCIATMFLALVCWMANMFFDVSRTAEPNIVICVATASLLLPLLPQAISTCKNCFPGRACLWISYSSWQACSAGSSAGTSILHPCWYCMRGQHRQHQMPE